MKKMIFALFAAALFAAGCTPKQPLALVPAAGFDRQIDGKQVALYTLTNKNGMTLQTTNYGTRVVSLWVPDKAGQFADVVLGFNTLEDYINSGEPYFGCTAGRVANRIKEGKFTLDSVEYALFLNNGPNTLHGGKKGFNNVVWNVDTVTENKIVFSYVSADMEEGFPGELTTQLTYELTPDNEFKITYDAQTTKKTVVNLTHHSFFNLAGEGSGTINDHLLMLNADLFTPVDSTLIPTGEILAVEGTPMDFRMPTAIGARVDENFTQLAYGKGYDHNWVLKKATDGELALAATVEEPVSGRVMEIFTTEPAIQFYGGNFLNSSDTGKSGKTYDFRAALCLETQHYPDAPNQANFPSIELVPGEKYTQTCIYKFSVKQ